MIEKVGFFEGVEVAGKEWGAGEKDGGLDSVGGLSQAGGIGRGVAKFSEGTLGRRWCFCCGDEALLAKA